MNRPVYKIVEKVKGGKCDCQCRNINWQSPTVADGIRKMIETAYDKFNEIIRWNQINIIYAKDEENGSNGTDK